MRVVCQQLSPSVGALEANCEASVDGIRDAVAHGGDLVVLPELVTAGYMFESVEEARSTAIPVTDPLFDRWAAEISKVSGGHGLVVGGFCELGDDGRLYNSAAIVNGEGVVAVYRKTHLWDREKLFFEPGTEPPPVLETELGRIGVLICYDLEFPELTRSLALRGAELIGCPTNWPIVPRPEGEHPPEVIIAMAAARTNRIFIACCDRAGTERGQRWTEGSSVIDANGWIVATAESGGAWADIDLAQARVKTLTPLAGALSDRRPELYAEVISAEAATGADPVG